MCPLQTVYKARTLPKDGSSSVVVIAVGGANEQIWFRQKILV